MNYEREKFAAQNMRKNKCCRIVSFTICEFGYEDVLQDYSHNLKYLTRTTIRVTFAAQYTAGKSSIIYA